MSLVTEDMFKEIEALVQEINNIERNSIDTKDDPLELEKTKKDRDRLEFSLRRDLVQNYCDDGEFWANINWFRENGTLEDADLLMKVKRNILSFDHQSKFVSMINAAIKKIFDRDISEAEQFQSLSETVSKSRKAEILEQVQRHAAEVLGDEKRAEVWLHTPIPSLGYKVPVTLLDSEPGTAKVEHILNCIDFGVIS